MDGVDGIEDATTVPAKSGAARQIRGSSLLLAGRMISLGTNFLVQVLIVRYLQDKSDYGDFAYALSIVTIATTFVALGTDRAIGRFLPIYQERGRPDAMLGTIVFVTGTIVSLGIALILFVLAFQDLVGGSLLSDQAGRPPAHPHRARAHPGARRRPDERVRRLLEPAVDLLPPVRPEPIAAASGRRAPDLPPGGRRVPRGRVRGDRGDRRRGVRSPVPAAACDESASCPADDDRTFSFPMREILGFSVPLLTTDLVYILLNASDVVLLGAITGDPEAVANYRVIQPVALLNLIVLQSFTLLFIPATARLFARDDREGLRSLYWQTAAWVAVLSFPIFAVTFALAKPLTVALFEQRYAESAIFLSIIALGRYYDAALGFNGLTLRVFGNLKAVVGVNLAAALRERDPAARPHPAVRGAGRGARDGRRPCSSSTR